MRHVQQQEQDNNVFNKTLITAQKRRKRQTCKIKILKHRDERFHSLGLIEGLSMSLLLRIIS